MKTSVQARMLTGVLIGMLTLGDVQASALPLRRLYRRRS